MRLACWLLALALAAPAAPKAVATASKTEVSVGETFTVEVTASGPAGATFAFAPAASQESFELKSLPDSGAAAPPGLHRYAAQVFAVGDAQVPAIPVRYRLADGTTGEVQTAPIPLKVVSLLPRAKEQQQLADVRPPLSVAVGRAFWIGLAVALLLIAALTWWLVTRKRRAAPEVVKVVPEIPADQEARASLASLVSLGRLARGEYRPFYIELTAIAKRYLERKLGAPIVEMTTAEMLAHLRAVPQAADLAPTLRDLSGAADQIKFAKGSGLTEEAERHLAAARSLVDTVEQRLRPAAAPEGGQAA